MKQITKIFPSIAEARAHYIRQGYLTVESNEYSAIMTRHRGGNKTGEVIINKDGFLNVLAEELLNEEPAY